jgi:hypothetical protein
LNISDWLHHIGIRDFIDSIPHEIEELSKRYYKFNCDTKYDENHIIEINNKEDDGNENK